MPACTALMLVGLVSCVPWSTVTSTGSVYRGQCTHVGLRGHSVLDTYGDEGASAAVSLQVTTDAPNCAAVYLDAGH